MHPHVGWGLFALQATKADDEVLSFVGKFKRKQSSKICARKTHSL
jgi:hypothetical protein